MRLKRSFLVAAGAIVVALSTAAYPAFASGAAGSPSHETSADAPTLVPYLPTTTNSAITGPVEQFPTADGTELDCWNANGWTILSVNATNIHIWTQPGGAPAWEINKGAWFDSSWMIKDSSGTYQGPYHCASYGPDNNTFWVYGFRNYGDSPIGWVGMQYLDIYEFED
jgi:hypothetical protein